MVRKIQAKLVLRLHGQGYRDTRSQGSKACRAGAWPTCWTRRRPPASAGMTSPTGRTTGVYALLFPGRGERESVYEQPGWARPTGSWPVPA